MMALTQLLHVIQDRSIMSALLPMSPVIYHLPHQLINRTRLTTYAWSMIGASERTHGGGARKHGIVLFLLTHRTKVLRTKLQTQVLHDYTSPSHDRRIAAMNLTASQYKW
jgi:hypothetical protein